MVYFVLYIVILVELLVVITERDELEAKDHQIREKMLTTIAETYKQPLILTVPQRSSEYNVNQPEPMRVVLTATGLTSEEEKEALKFFINYGEGRIPKGFPKTGLTFENSTDEFKSEKNNGNAVFVARIKDKGEYKFSAYCEVERQLPKYLPDYLQDSLKTMVGEYMTAKSLWQEFEIEAKYAGGVKKKRAEVLF